MRDAGKIAESAVVRASELQANTRPRCWATWAVSPRNTWSVTCLYVPRHQILTYRGRQWGDGLLLGVPAGLRPCGRLYPPDGPCRPRRQRGVGAADRAGLPRRQRRAGRLPGTDAVGLFHRGHPDAGRTAGRGRGRGARRGGGVRRPDARPGDRCTAAVRAPDLQHRGGHPPRSGARCRAQVVPADVPRVLRAPPDGGRRSGARDDPDGRGDLADVPFGPDLLFTATDVPGFVLHVEICEDMFVPVPPSAQAALAGATVLANLSGSPITIGRAEDRCLLARSASSRCLAAYVYAAAGEGESTTDLAWDGQTMVWENGLLPCAVRAVPEGGATLDRRRGPRTVAVRAAADGHLRRQPHPSRHHPRFVPAGGVRARSAVR